MKFYVYTHTRPDTNNVFYVGKGQKERAKNNYHRNKYWKNIVNKNNGIFLIDIVYCFDNETDALVKETELILFYGLKNLCNLNTGGLGNSGFTHSAETRERMSKSAMGKVISESQRQKLRDANLGKKAPPRSKKFTDFLSTSRTGKGNPMYGKKVKESSKQLQRDRLSGANNYLSRLILNIETGIYYDCLTDAAKSKGIDKRYIWINIKKNKVNKTPFIYA